jgi:transposase
VDTVSVRFLGLSGRFFAEEVLGSCALVGDAPANLSAGCWLFEGQRLARRDSVRVTTAFSRLLRLPGVWVRKVRFEPDRVIVEVALKRRRLVCPECGYSVAARKDTRPEDSVWRHLDLGVWRLEVHCWRRRLWCPEHGARTESVPFARPGAEFTRDFECLVIWLMARADKSTVKRLLRIDWDTVGRIVKRVCDDELDPDRLEDLYDIGVDEVSWKRQHNYLTLLADHRRGKIVWGTNGAGEKAADRFFAELDPEIALSPAPDHEPASQQPLVGERAGSSWRSPGHGPRVRRLRPQARPASSDLHRSLPRGAGRQPGARRGPTRVRAAGLRRQAGRQARTPAGACSRSPRSSPTSKPARSPGSVAAGGEVWRAYALKEAVRGIFAPGLTVEDVEILIGRLRSRLARCRLDPSIRLGKTIRRHRDGSSPRSASGSTKTASSWVEAERGRH